MHGAPSVSYPAGRSRRARALLAALWAGGAGAAAAWVWQQAGGQLAPTDPRPWLVFAAVLLAGLAAWRANAAPAGELRWDGQGWTLPGAALTRPARVEVHLDLQSLFLLRLVAPGEPARWLWLERGSRPESWRDLRRAVYSRAPAADVDADSRPASGRPAGPPFS